MHTNELIFLACLNILGACLVIRETLKKEKNVSLAHIFFNVFLFSALAPIAFVLAPLGPKITSFWKWLNKPMFNIQK